MGDAAPMAAPSPTALEAETGGTIPELSVANLLDGAPDVTFYGIGRNAFFGIALDDVNGDGAVDLIAPDSPSDVLRIYANNGMGELQPPEVITTGASPAGIAVADFDGNQWLDLAVSNYDDDSISIFFGDEAGGYSSVAEIPVDDKPTYLQSLDMEGNGTMDLVVNDDYSSNILLLRNDGNGVFTPDDPITLQPGGELATEVSDLNGDSFQDLIVIHPLGAQISVLLNDGEGGFGPSTEFPVDSGPEGIAVGDFNGDEAPDLVVGSRSGTVSVLQNDGSGAFTAGEVLEPGGILYAAAAADMTGDGALDLLVADGGSFNLHVFPNRGDGTFEAAVSFPTFPVGPFHLYLADMDMDDIDEIVAAGASRAALFDFADADEVR